MVHQLCQLTWNNVTRQMSCTACRVEKQGVPSFWGNNLTVENLKIVALLCTFLWWIPVLCSCIRFVGMCTFSTMRQRQTMLSFVAVVKKPNRCPVINYRNTCVYYSSLENNNKLQLAMSVIKLNWPQMDLYGECKCPYEMNVGSWKAWVLITRCVQHMNIEQNNKLL